MNVIIIDDELIARELLKKMLEKYCYDIKICSLESNITDAYKAICAHKPDLIFLDIEMPNGNCFELIDMFDNNIFFDIVFTTAYDNYAIRAIKNQASDYLLKPIDVDELLIAIGKVRNKLYTKIVSTSRTLSPSRKIPLAMKDGIIYVNIMDITRVESDGGYSTFYMQNKKNYITSRNLKEYENLLPQKDFFRVHKSHLVNMRHVKKFLRTDGYFVEMEDGSIVEMSRRKKDDFLRMMEKFE